MQDGLVMRYDHSKSEDGLAGSEGKFLACSFLDGIEPQDDRSRRGCAQTF